MDVNCINIANIGLRSNRRAGLEGGSSGEKPKVCFDIKQAESDSPGKSIEQSSSFTVSRNSQPKTDADKVSGRDDVEGVELLSDNGSPVAKTSEKQVTDGPSDDFGVTGEDVTEGESSVPAAEQSQNEGSGNHILTGLFKSGRITLEQLNTLKDDILASAPEGNGLESALGGLKPNRVAEPVANLSPGFSASLKPLEGNPLQISQIANYLGISTKELLSKYKGQNSGLEKIAVDIEAAGEEQKVTGKVVSDVSRGVDGEVLNFQGTSSDWQVKPIAQGQASQKAGVVFKGDSSAAEASAKVVMNKEGQAVPVVNKEGEAIFAELSKHQSSSAKSAANNTEVNQAELDKGKVDAGQVNTGEDVSAKLGDKQTGVESVFGGLGAKSSENNNVSSRSAAESFTVESLLQKSQQVQQDGGEIESSGFSSKNSVGSEFGQAVPAGASRTQAASPNVSSGSDGTNGDILLNATSAKIGVQLQESIRSSIGGDRQQITVQLNPPELGKVSLKFDQEEGGLKGLLQVSKAETRYDIERALPEVIRNLSDSGIQIKRVEVTVAQQNNSQQQGFKEQSSYEDGWQDGDYQQETNFGGQQQNAEGDNDSGNWGAGNTGMRGDFDGSAEQLYSGSLIDAWV